MTTGRFVPQWHSCTTLKSYRKFRISSPSIIEPHSSLMCCSLASLPYRNIFRVSAFVCIWHQIVCHILFFNRYLSLTGTPVFPGIPGIPCSPCKPIAPGFPEGPLAPSSPCGPVTPLGPSSPRFPDWIWNKKSSSRKVKEHKDAHRPPLWYRLQRQTLNETAKVSFASNWSLITKMARQPNVVYLSLVVNGQ